MTTKTCFKCLAEKPMEAFYKHASMGDGRLGKCKECTKSAATAHRQANLENIRSYDKMRSSMPHRMALNIKVNKAYRLNYPNRAKANSLVQHAVLSGRLLRQPCWVCGVKAVAHHPDYDRPLDVVWLCHPHHKQAHATGGVR
jgi:hypothetical protein